MFSLTTILITKDKDVTNNLSYHLKIFMTIVHSYYHSPDVGECSYDIASFQCVDLFWVT